MNFSHNLFILFGTLTRIKNENLLKSLFIEGVNEAQDEAFLEWRDIMESEYLKENGVSLHEVRSGHFIFGYVKVTKKKEEPFDETHIVIRNGIRVLAQLLENLKINKILEDEKMLLQEAVREKTLEVFEKKEELEAYSEELQISNESLTEANRRILEALDKRKKFMINMSYELRTPMNGILGMIRLALQSKLNEEQAELLSLAEESSLSMMKVLNDILDLSQIEAGKVKVSAYDFSIRACIKSIEELLVYRSIKRNSDFIVFFHGDIPELVYGDEKILKRVLINLFSETSKLSGNKPLLVIIKREEDRGKDRKSFFSFEFTDRSSEKENLPEIELITPDFSDFGISFSLIKELVKLLEGDSELKREPGKGFSCKIFIPLKLKPDFFEAPDLQ